MPGVDISTAFKAIGEVPADYFKANKSQSVPEEHVPQGLPEFCYALEDVFVAMQEEGDYSMLRIALKFMDGLYPEDLFMFFDELFVIEEKLFDKHNIDYSGIATSYHKHRQTINQDYIKFILSYHHEATSWLFSTDKEYSRSQMQFLVNRNKILLDVFPQIGTKISRRHYADYVIADSSEFTG